MDMVTSLLLLWGSVSLVIGSLVPLKENGKVVAVFEGDPNGQGVAWYKTYEGRFANGAIHRKGKMTLPGGASYVGKFKKGKPRGKGTLGDITGKMMRAKFSSSKEIFNKMFTSKCNVSISLPSKFVTKGKPVENNQLFVEPVYSLQSGGYYIGKIKKKTGEPKKSGSVFLVQYNGSWLNGAWEGLGNLSYPGGWNIQGNFHGGKPANVVGSSEEGGFTFEGELGESAWANIPSDDLLHSCSVGYVPCMNCTTTNGKLCQFPFFVNGAQYDSCTMDYTSPGESPWCALKVDGSGNWIAALGDDSFGYCDSTCPTDQSPGQVTACPHKDIGFPSTCSKRHSRTHKNILFLGNSYTYQNQLKSVVKSLAEGAGFSADVSENSQGGVTLAWHASNSLSNIRSGDWDAVVMQDQSQRPSFGPQFVFHNIVPDTITLVKTIRETNPCTVPIFFQTWGKRDGDTNNCANGATFLCTYEGVQDQLTQSYSTFAYVNQPAKVAPAGEAWRTYSNRNSLFSGDGSHPSPSGTFLTACTIFEQIWGVPCSKSNYSNVGDAAALKAQSTKTVNQEQWSWPGDSGAPCSQCLG